MDITALTKVDGLNVKAGLALSMEDEDLYATLLTLYLTLLENTLAELNAHIQNNDWQAFAQACHSLKGASANIAMDSLAEQCNNLDKTIRVKHVAPDASDYQALIDNIKLAISQLQQASIG